MSYRDAADSGEGAETQGDFEGVRVGLQIPAIFSALYWLKNTKIKVPFQRSDYGTK